jgi:CheY-like chemotaxis protein
MGSNLDAVAMRTLLYCLMLKNQSDESPCGVPQRRRANDRFSMSDKIHILMVDDNPGKLLTYEAILNNLGHNLIKANCAAEALDHLLKTDIAVILMDVNMPEQDGFQLANMVRQHPRFQDVAIIFISAVHLTDADRLRG